MRKVLLLVLVLPLIAAHPVPHVVQQEAIASQSAAAAASGTQEALTITVTSGTSFTATPNLWLTQSQVQTVGTIDQALAQLPKTINHAVTINVGAGTYASATVSGFSGAGSITITGTLAVTAFGGDDTGTCNAATTTTCTPTAPGWTASQALGSLVEFTDVGVGTLAYRSPTIQTTGVMTFLAVSFLNANDTYRIVAPSSIVTALTVKQNNVPVTFNYMKIAGLTEMNNASVEYQACQFSGATVTSTNNRLETFTNSVFAASSVPTFTDTAKLVLTNTVLHVSNMTATGVRRITGDVVALATTTTPALTLSQVDQAVMGFDAKNCTFTPLSLDDVATYRVSGIGLTGTSNTGAVGVASSGATTLAYASTPTLVGTANASANGTTHTWANAATTSAIQYGGVKYVSSAGVTWGTAGGNSTVVGTLQINTSLNVASNSTVSGSFSTSYAAVSGSGSAIGDATAASSVSTVFITGGGANSGLLLPAPTATPAKVQDYINKSGNTILIYPSSGSTQINSLGLGAAYTLTDGSAIRVYPASTTLYYVIALN